jgi:hypothetical protein
MRAVIAAMICAFVGVAMGACNNVGTCPGADKIVNGGSCNGDNLECPYTLQSPSPACDGTMVDGGIATSCVCTSGSWACPVADVCEGGTGDDAGTDGASDDGGGGTDAAIEGGSDGASEGAAGGDSQADSQGGG